MHEENLDDLIRSKLEHIESSFSEEDWEEMERSLDGFAGEEKNPFDEQVAAKLAHHSTYLRPADWEEMVEYLEAPFDAAIRQKLEFHSVGKPGAYAWMLMRSRLRASEGAFRYGPWLTAAAAVSLVLVSVWLMKPGTSIRRMDQNTLAAAPSFQPPASGGDKGTATPNQTTLSQSMPPRLRKMPPFGNQSAIAQPIDGSIDAREVQQPEPTPVLLADATQNVTATQETQRSEGPVIHRLPFRFSDIGNPMMTTHPVIRVLNRFTHRRRDISLEAYAANTSTRAELSGPDAGPGFMTGVRGVFPVKGNWSVVTGMQYGKKKFSHEYYVISDRAYLNAIEGELNVVEAPMMLRHAFPSRKKFSLFAQAGVVTMLSISEEYKHYDPVAPANRGILTLAPAEDLKPQVQQRRLNTYPGNILMALGLRYKISEELALQAEPYFQQGIQRTKGSDSFRFEKKLSTAGMGLGLSWTFKGREEAEPGLDGP
ncbi:MAG: PorT family protein [Bacteroidetes bacterium]|nr:MAG: PorT family protein [Bacteroidota bacterium]